MMLGADEVEPGHEFESLRPLLLGIAYRMLSSLADAEDVVQEAYLRYRSAPEGSIRYLKAYLSAIVTRLCINQLQSARRRKETYVGPWLPEPLPSDATERLSPEKSLTQSESISMAFLVLLETLTPLERAVFLLREAFDYEYSEIAGIVEKSEAACRQLISRARKHIKEGRPRFKTSSEERERIVASYARAVGVGDVDGLRSLLADDVALWADGGGKARGAATRPVIGSGNVVAFLMASRRYAAQEAANFDISEINGETSVILREYGRALVVMTFEISDRKIQVMRFVANPDKLTRI